MPIKTLPPDAPRTFLLPPVGFGKIDRELGAALTRGAAEEGRGDATSGDAACQDAWGRDLALSIADASFGNDNPLHGSGAEAEARVRREGGGREVAEGGEEKKMTRAVSARRLETGVV